MDARAYGGRGVTRCPFITSCHLAAERAPSVVVGSLVSGSLWKMQKVGEGVIVRNTAAMRCYQVPVYRQVPPHCRIR